ncbi:9-O-acetyl-N-acetylneuraminate esterase [Candidatus Magnetomorum sp. HK-1]|nr:9-O-acetyl-N-acetylneuraminate esterase [Candidatus Magnetomorum sp. HK-1]
MKSTTRKRFPLNRSDFKDIIEGNYYFIDKTMFIHNLIVDDTDIVLFPRARRFGKTCNISMLRYFFEKTEASNAHLFEGLAIRNAETWHYQGKYPVIYISLRNTHGKTWSKCLTHLTHELSSEFIRHSYLLDSKLLHSKEKSNFEAIINQDASETDYAFSLKNLSKYLSQYYSQKVIILCDEYDTPIHDGYLNN